MQPTTVSNSVLLQHEAFGILASYYQTQHLFWVSQALSSADFHHLFFSLQPPARSNEKADIYKETAETCILNTPFPSCASSQSGPVLKFTLFTLSHSHLFLVLSPSSGQLQYSISLRVRMGRTPLPLDLESTAKICAWISTVLQRKLSHAHNSLGFLVMFSETCYEGEGLQDHELGLDLD